MDFLQRARDGVSQIFRALHAKIAGFFRARFVERLGCDGVCECGDGAAIVDLGLRALGLELAQNARELGDLVVTEIELVGQKSERTANAETAAAVSPIAVTVVATSSSPTFERATAARISTVAGVSFSTTVMRAARFLGVLPELMRMHCFFLTREDRSIARGA